MGRRIIPIAQDLIDDAVTSRLQTVTVPPGTIVFSNTALTIANASDLVVEATGVTLVFCE